MKPRPSQMPAVRPGVPEGPVVVLNALMGVWQLRWYMRLVSREHTGDPFPALSPEQL